MDRKEFEEMLGRVAKLNMSQRKRMLLALSDTAEGRVEGVGTPSVNSAGHGPDKTSDDNVMTKSGLLAVSSGQLGRRGCPQVRMELLRANASGLAAKSVSVEQGGPRGCSAVSNAVEM